MRRQRRWAAARGVAHDVRGYVRALESNLRAPLLSVDLAELARGSELEPSPTRPPRLHSLYSSAALVLNVFAHWRGRDVSPLVASLGVRGGAAAGAQLSFEEPLPTALPGDPPTTDVALRWPGRLVAIESKLGEWLVRRPRGRRVFKDKYFPPSVRVWEAAGLPRCQVLAEALQAGHWRSKWLHAAQLLKHALGMARSGAADRTLVYLYYEHEARESAAHRAELDHLRERLVGEVEFVTRSYQELYAALCADPAVDAEYLRYLGERYFR